MRRANRTRWSWRSDGRSSPRRIHGWQLAWLALPLALAMLAACDSSGNATSASTDMTTIAGISDSSGDTASGTGSPDESSYPATSSTHSAPTALSGSTNPTNSQSGSAASDPAQSSQSAPPTTSSSAPAKKVHVSTFEGDDKTYGVGIAVMVLFSVAPTDSSAFIDAATVTVNGKPADGAWFWQKPTSDGYALEALYREKDYWPAHSTIAVDLPVGGLSAGPGLVYEDSLTVTFQTGAAHVSQVNNAEHTMTVTSDGKVAKNFPVSLGSADTPTFDGAKVVMAKGSVDPKTGKPRPDGTVEMKSEPGDADPYDLMVPWSVRITNSGEFIHSAKWNTGNIGSRNTSHGCTNLDVADAKWFYQFSLIGDVVEYPDANAEGRVQPSWDGWGWWNIPWSRWQRGGNLLTTTS